MSPVVSPMCQPVTAACSCWFKVVGPVDSPEGPNWFQSITLYRSLQVQLTVERGFDPTSEKKGPQ